MTDDTKSGKRRSNRMLAVNKKMAALNATYDSVYGTAILLAAGNAAKEIFVERYGCADEEANELVRSMITRSVELLGETLQSA